MNLNDIIGAIESIESDRKIDREIIIDSLKEALIKAYRKQTDLLEADVEIEIAENGEISIRQKYLIVEEVENDDTEMSLEHARDINPNYKLGDYHYVYGSIEELGRPAALLAKNVLKQKIREAEKQGVYDKYIGQLGDLVNASIETIEDKFIIVNLGETLALMPKAAQIPNERYYEGQKIKVIISEVNKETKGAQILVSRADEQLVRRLFEREIPEIYQGIVEIKAIAREAGERTKVAVFSKHSDVDALGACIGPGGSRVHEIIDEIKGEKIDVFEWSDDIVELVKNALAPAKVITVVPLDKKNLLVVVDDDQLSLAIGKKGKNARLAVKLTGKKIDIKTPTLLEEAGTDYKSLEADYLAKIEEEKALKRIEEELFAKAQTQLEPEVATEELVEEVEVSELELLEKALKEKKSREPKVRKDYVSKFENIGEVKKTESKVTRKKKKDEEEERRLRDSEIRKEKEYEILPEYSEEELAEIQKMQSESDASWLEDDIDFDEFDEFYDE